MAESTDMPVSEAGPPQLTDEEILIPHREVKLTNGTRVLVAPWGAIRGRLVLARLEALQPKIFRPPDEIAEDGQRKAFVTNAREILARAWDETVDLVSLTVDVPRKEIEKPVLAGGWAFEDVLAVTDAMLDVCVIRSDGSGALPLLIGLVARMGEILVRTATPLVARPLSSASGKEASSRATSGNGSASHPKTKEGSA